MLAVASKQREPHQPKFPKRKQVGLVSKLRNCEGPSSGYVDRSRSDEAATALSGQWRLVEGVAVKDTVLPPTQKRISRQQQDKLLIEATQEAASQAPPRWLRKIATGEGNELTSLQRACLRVLAANLATSADVQEQLHYGSIPQKCVKDFLLRVQSLYTGQAVPFSVWETLAGMASRVSLSNAFPAALRCYTGLVFDDEQELSRYNTCDTDANVLLDLSNTAFQKTDIYKIRMLCAHSLTALRLDHLVLLDDDSITALARDAGSGADKIFSRLEILTLQGCKLITDQSAAKFARFPSLKLLDLRGTSCTSATKALLRQQTAPPYMSAFTDVHMWLYSAESLDEAFERLSKASKAPLVKNLGDLAKATASADQDAHLSILITELSRLDPSKVHDPRMPTVKREFRSYHHTYGVTYTTAPIDHDSLREDGAEEDAKGGAFRHGAHASVMSGKLPISLADVNWRRTTKARPKRKDEDDPKAPQETPHDSGLEDGETESDTEIASAQVDEKQETLPATDPVQRLLQSFYQRIAPDPQPVQGSTLPVKNELMLLRFPKPTRETVSSDIAQPPVQQILEHRREQDWAPLRVKKKARTGASGASVARNDVLDFGFANPSANRKRTLSPAVSSQSIQTGQPAAPQRPVSIMRKLAGGNKVS